MSRADGAHILSCEFLAGFHVLDHK
jgi:hypothetical protein